MTTACSYRSSWTDSGDRGADMANHNRRAHPDHEHVWGDSLYAWDQIGAIYTRSMETLARTECVQRCTVCAILPNDVEVCPIAYKSITTLADGYDSYCRNCDDFTVYDCPVEECGGIFCVCCEDGCEECGATIDFSR